MAVKQKFYSSLDRAPEGPKMFDAKKEADAHDLYLEAMYTIADMLISSKIIDSEEQAEKISEAIVQQREEIMPLLRKIPKKAVAPVDEGDAS